MKRLFKVVLDTNFLMIPAQFGVDIFSEVQRVVNYPFEAVLVRQTVEELERIAQHHKGADKRAAKLALALIEKKNLKILDVSDDKIADDAIVKIVDEDYIIATQDIGLKKRVRAKGGKIITMRQKSHLIIEGI